MLGVRGIRFKYLWLPGSRSVAAKGPILCVGIPVLAIIASVSDLYVFWTSPVVPDTAMFIELASDLPKANSLAI